MASICVKRGQFSHIQNRTYWLSWWAMYVAERPFKGHLFLVQSVQDILTSSSAFLLQNSQVRVTAVAGGLIPNLYPSQRGMAKFRDPM